MLYLSNIAFLFIVLQQSNGYYFWQFTRITIQIYGFFGLFEVLGLAFQTWFANISQWELAKEFGDTAEFLAFSTGGVYEHYWYVQNGEDPEYFAQSF